MDVSRPPNSLPCSLTSLTRVSDGLFVTSNDQGLAISFTKVLLRNGKEVRYKALHVEWVFVGSVGFLPTVSTGLKYL